MNIKLLLYLFFGISLFSCSLFESDNNDEVVARVGDKILLKEDLKNLISSTNQEDSLSIVNSYIDNWVKEQLLLQKALQNLDDSQSDFEEQLENYKNSLIIFAYENQLIKQKLDTNVSFQDIKSYYKENKTNFELKREIAQLKFVKILNTAPKLDSVKYWLFEEGTNNGYSLNEYCAQFAIKCHLDSSMWLDNSTLFLALKNAGDSTLKFETKMGESIISDSLNTIIMTVFDKKKIGEYSPISYVKDQIKSILINKRKIELISTVKKEIYEEATLKKRYEIY